MVYFKSLTNALAKRLNRIDDNIDQHIIEVQQLIC
jgi:tetrahydromethanopterin S-methyltransferase subunit G